MSSSTKPLQNVAPANKFLNAAATETTPLFDYPEFGFPLEYHYNHERPNQALDGPTLAEVIRNWTVAEIVVRNESNQQMYASLP